MTEQRCPAMKFCFIFLSLPLSLPPPARLSADGALMHRMLPIPPSYIHISYTLIRLYTFGEARNLNLQQKKNGIEWMFFGLFSEYFWVRCTRCARSAGSAVCPASSNNVRGVVFGSAAQKCQRLTRFHVFSWPTGVPGGGEEEGNCGRFSIWGQAYNQHNRRNNAH